MDASTLIDWKNKANTMIREFAYEVLRLSRQVIDAYGLPLNESEFLIVLSISTLTITVIFNEIRKPRTRTYIPAKGAPRQNKRNKIQMQEEGSKPFTKKEVFEFYTNPGTFELRARAGKKRPLFSGKYGLYPKKPVSLESSEEKILDSLNWLFGENE